MPNSLLVRDVELGYGDAFQMPPITFEVSPGDVVGVIGPNGSGKSTLLKGVAGVQHEPSGEWNRFTCTCDSGTDVRAELFKVVAENRWTLRELKVEKRNLEDVFVSMTTKETDG